MNSLAMWISFGILGVQGKQWPKNDTAKDDPYETPTFVYNKEMD
jgi:hypothetical protein